MDGLAPQWAPQGSRGSVPATKASVRTFGHPGRARRPVSLSMSTKTMPSGGAGNGVGLRPPSAAFMKSTQIGRAALVPERPTGVLSSKPTHTTHRRSGVKPANHASR